MTTPPAPALWEHLIQWQPATAAALTEHLRALPDDWPARVFGVGRPAAALTLPPAAIGEQYPDRVPEIAPYDEIASLETCPACKEAEDACRFHEGYSAGHHERNQAERDAVSARPDITLREFIAWQADVSEAEDRGQEPPALPAAPSDRVTLTRDHLAALLAHHADVIASRWDAYAPDPAAYALRRHADELTADEETTAVRELLDSIMSFTAEQQPAVPSAPADTDLTAEEARTLADDLGLKLYRAQDSLAFVEECCTIADREQRTVTTADVRGWLKGARCGRQLAASAADALRERVADAIRGLNQGGMLADLDEDSDVLALADAVLAVLPAHTDRAAVLRETADEVQQAGEFGSSLRDRLRRAFCEASGFDWDPDSGEADEYGEHADAAIAVFREEDAR